jgi:hypothetical protein
MYDLQPMSVNISLIKDRLRSLKILMIMSLYVANQEAFLECGRSSELVQQYDRQLL